MSNPDAGAVDVAELSEIVARLRRALRTAVRGDVPWETLPMAQVEILQRLADESGVRVRDLADRHRLAPNTVSNLIQQMVTTGLVTRDPDPDDRRAVIVSLTPQGEQALTEWAAANTRRLDAALAGRRHGSAVGVWRCVCDYVPSPGESGVVELSRVG